MKKMTKHLIQTVLLGFLFTGTALAQEISFERIARSTVFQQEYPVPHGFTTDFADVSGNGINEALTIQVSPANLLTYHWNTAQQKYSENLRISFDMASARFADFQNEGYKKDLVYTRQGTLRYLLNSLSSSNWRDMAIEIPAPEDFSGNFAPYGVIAFDINNNGRDDIVVGQYENGGNIFVYLNEGPDSEGVYEFAYSHTIASPAGNVRWHQLMAVDLNNNGYKDLIGYHSEFVVFENINGTGEFNVITVPESGGSIPKFGDLNGNGLIDIATLQIVVDEETEEQERVLAVWFNQGDFEFEKVHKSLPMPWTGFAGFGDFNDNGKLELAISTSEGLAVISNDGLGNFNDVAFLSEVAVAPDNWGNVTGWIYDVNGNGRLDVVLKNAIYFNLEPDDPESWTVSLKAEQGDFFADASLGMHENASDGLDDFDTPEPPPGLNPVRAFFSYPEWDDVLGPNYIDDIRALADLNETPATWNVYVYADDEGEVSVTFTRPEDFDYPIIVRNDDGEVVVVDLTSGEFSFVFESDGESFYQFEIQIGDNTPPDLSLSDIFSGPQIWNASDARTLTWTVSDDGGMDELKIEFSVDGGETYTEIFSDDGSADSYEFTPAGVSYTLQAVFRVTATDLAQNQTVAESHHPIAIADAPQTSAFDAGWHIVSNPGLTEIERAEGTFLFGWTGFGFERKEAMAIGNGYWLGASTAETLSAGGAFLETGSEVNAASGWDMLGSPLVIPVNTDSLLIEIDETTYSFSDAVDANLVAGPFLYDGSAYVLAEEFDPFKGVWFGVNSEHDAVVTFPVHVWESDELMEKRFDMQSDETSSPVLALVINDGDVSQTLKMGPELRDIPLPPAPPGSFSTGLVGESTPLGNLYYSKFLDFESERNTPLKTSGVARDITISWQGLDSELEDVRFVLVASDGTEYDLNREGSLIWRTSDRAPVIVSSQVTASSDMDDLPRQLSLNQNYPNPFNPATTISFEMPEAGHVNLEVFNMLGQRVAVLISENRSAGSHHVNFDASRLTSGTYIYRLQVGDMSINKKMMLMK